MCYGDTGKKELLRVPSKNLSSKMSTGRRCQLPAQHLTPTTAEPMVQNEHLAEAFEEMVVLGPSTSTRSNAGAGAGATAAMSRAHGDPCIMWV
jgi:hypothetical protein